MRQARDRAGGFGWEYLGGKTPAGCRRYDRLDRHEITVVLGLEFRRLGRRRRILASGHLVLCGTT